MSKVPRRDIGPTLFKFRDFLLGVSEYDNQLLTAPRVNDISLFVKT